MRWFYHIARVAVRIVFFLFTSCSKEGLKTIPRKGPLLVIANHLGLADPPLVSVSVKRETVFMAKEELFSNWFTNYFIRSFGAFPVRRSAIDRKALRTAEEVLKAEKVLVMFPESSRSVSKALKEAYPGVSMIALKTGATMVPLGITGTENMQGYSWLLKRPKVKLVVGKPFNLPPVKGKITRELLAESTDIIMEHLAEILPESYRGIYKNKKRHDGNND